MLQLGYQHLHGMAEDKKLQALAKDTAEKILLKLQAWHPVIGRYLNLNVDCKQVQDGPGQPREEQGIFKMQVLVAALLTVKLVRCPWTTLIRTMLYLCI